MSALKEVSLQRGLSPDELAREVSMDRRTIDKHLANGTMTPLLRRQLRALTRQRKTLVAKAANVILEAYRERKDRYLNPDQDGDHLLLYLQDQVAIRSTPLTWRGSQTLPTNAGCRRFHLHRRAPLGRLGWQSPGFEALRRR